MARKKLLTEGEIRHFMKLANLTPLTETYLSEQPEMEMDLDVEEGPPAPEGGDEMPPEMDMGMEPEEGDLEDEGDPLLDIPEEAREELLGDLVDLLADRLGVDASVEGGEELEVDADVEMDMEEPGMPGEEGPPEEMGAELDVEEEPGMRGYQEGQEIEEEGRRPVVGGAAAQSATADKPSFASGRKQSKKAKGPGDPEYDPEEEFFGKDKAKEVAEQQDAIVAEVARRVAARLVAEKQREEVSDQLAERIFARLTAKK
jgi:hypothetical protein